MHLKPGSVLALFRADYFAHRGFANEMAHLRPGYEYPRENLLRALLRVILNPALRAVLALRLANASPRLLWPFWRNYFVHLHSMDWTGKLEIGPGLYIPHPFGICLIAGARLGENVTVGHNCTVAGAADGKTPVLREGVLLFPGAMVVGGIEIGTRTCIGANCVVREDVPAHKLVTERGIVPVTSSDQLWPYHPDPGADDGANSVERQQ